MTEPTSTTAAQAGQRDGDRPAADGQPDEGTRGSEATSSLRERLDALPEDRDPADGRRKVDPAAEPPEAADAARTAEEGRSEPAERWRSGSPAPTSAAGAAGTGSVSVSPSGEPTAAQDWRTERPGRPAATRSAGRAQPRRSRRARLVVERVDPWSVFLFSLVASVCLGIVLLVAVAALYAVLSGLGVLDSVNNLLGDVLGGSGPDGGVAPVFTAGRVLGATAVLAAVDVVLLTVLATLGAFLYNLCSSLTGGVEVKLRERD